MYNAIEPSVNMALNFYFYYYYYVGLKYVVLHLTYNDKSYEDNSDILQVLQNLVFIWLHLNGNNIMCECVRTCGWVVSVRACRQACMWLLM